MNRNSSFSYKADVEIEYYVTPYYPQSIDSPEEPSEVVIEQVLVDGEDISINMLESVLEPFMAKLKKQLEYEAERAAETKAEYDYDNRMDRDAQT